jgi:hypothetical protein
LPAAGLQRNPEQAEREVLVVSLGREHAQLGELARPEHPRIDHRIIRPGGQGGAGGHAEHDDRIERAALAQRLRVEPERNRGRRDLDRIRSQRDDDGLRGARQRAIATGYADRHDFQRKIPGQI